MKWLGEWRWACHLLAAVLLWLGPALPASDDVAHDMPSHVARPPNDSTTAEVQIWRTITLGTNKGVAAYREGLDAAAIKIGVSADEILGRPAVPYARMKTQVELALLSVAELGVEAEAASFQMSTDVQGRSVSSCALLRLDRGCGLIRNRDGAGKDVQRGPHDLGAGELRQRSRAHRWRWAIRLYGAPNTSLRVCPSRQWTSGGSRRFPMIGVVPPPN